MEPEIHRKGESMAGKQVGRPPKYRSVEEIQAKIDAYFEECKGHVMMWGGHAVTDKNGNPVIVDARPITVTGLALALGFNSRQSLLNYQAKKEFMDTIMRAKARVECYTEERLFDNAGANGAKFSLANNFDGWKDKHELDTDITVKKKLEELI